MAAEIKIVSGNTPQLERVMVIDAIQANARLLSDILRTISLCQVQWCSTDARAYSTAHDYDPQIIFVELSAEKVDGLEFTRRLRRSDFACRDVPVIMVTAEATAAGIMAARDAGVHEFLRRPYNMGDLKKRIDAVALRKRDWVEAVAYVGPDRRRFNSADYSGPRKRGSDEGMPGTQRINQALKIVRSAVNSIESDPKQVFRALKAQADDLAAISRSNPTLHALGQAAGEFQLYLAEAAKVGRLSRDKIETYGKALVQAAPPESRPTDAPRAVKAA